MATIARQANIKVIATETTLLAQLIVNAKFADIIARLDAIDAGIQEFDYDCGMCGDGTNQIFRRMTEDYDEVDACETCVNKYNLGHVAD